MSGRLLLVQPRFHAPKLDRNKGTIPPLGLAYVAAYTPPEWTVDILDEHVEERALPDADLVGITTTTLTITRAYEIARHYRQKGVPVVLGGVHASMLPDEALRFADSVVVGDAEPTWEGVVRDVEAGRLQPRYQAERPSLAGLREPRRDLFRGRYSFVPVSKSRGCPFNRSFCAINRFYDGSYRHRPVEEVVEELCRIDRPYVFFTDGNLYGYSKRDRADFKRLCEALVAAREKGALRVRYWMAYGSVNALDDDEALALAWRAGCRALFVGFESIDPASLLEMNKTVNVRYGPESYPRLIANAHRHGIAVVGEIVVGTDHDDLDSLAAVRDFVRSSGLDLLRLQILQPLPETDLFKRLEAEGRLTISRFPEDWGRLGQDFVMGVHYRTAHVAGPALQRWVVDTGREFYSNRALARRIPRIAARTRGLTVPALVLLNSLKSRRTYFNFAVGTDRVEDH